MHTLTIEYDHDDARLDQTGNEAEPCVDEIEVNLEYEPGEANYGADADGNRGISIPGYFYTEDSAPLKCEECGHIYTDAERQEIQTKMEKAANEYEYEPDEPDYDDRYFGLDM